MSAPRFGASVRVTRDGIVVDSGTFAGIADRKHGRVRVGHSLKTYPLANIVEVREHGDRWAVLHGAAH